MLGITGIVNNYSSSVTSNLRGGKNSVPEQTFVTNGISQLCVTYLCTLCYQHKSPKCYSTLDQRVYIYENQEYSLLFFVLWTDLTAKNGANLNSAKAAGASSTIYNSFTNPGYVLECKYNKLLNQCIPIQEPYGNMISRSPHSAVLKTQYEATTISSSVSDEGVSMSVGDTYYIYASCALPTRLTDHHSDWRFICNVGGRLATSFNTSTAVHFKDGYKAVITVTSIGNVTYPGSGWFSGVSNCVNSIQNTIITKKVLS